MTFWIAPLILFLGAVWWGIKSYREIRGMQYFEDTNHALIIMHETFYETCVRNKNEPNVFVLRESHADFKSAKGRHKSLIQECRYMNKMLLKNYPKGYKGE
jgi:hypothetical protein